MKNNERYCFYINFVSFEQRLLTDFKLFEASLISKQLKVLR